MLTHHQRAVATMEVGRNRVGRNPATGQQGRDPTGFRPERPPLTIELVDAAAPVGDVDDATNDRRCRIDCSAGDVLPFLLEGADVLGRNAALALLMMGVLDRIAAHLYVGGEGLTYPNESDARHKRAERPPCKPRREPTGGHRFIPSVFSSRPCVY